MTVRRDNWGRWSDDDEIGALNLITDEHVAGAATLVRRGKVLQLGRVLKHDTPGVESRPSFVHFLTTDGGDYAAGASAGSSARFADDYISMPVATGTHIDALAHGWSTRGLYNGHDPNLIRSRGAKVCGIDKAPGIVTGGVLADICRLRNIEILPPSSVVTAEELEAATEGRAKPGDALLIRTGWLSDGNVKARGLHSIEHEEPGIGSDAVDWIVERDIALVGADTFGVEVLPSDPGTTAPVHIRLLVDYGVHLIELLDLDELSSERPERFMFVVAPLRIRGGINSPLNPLAVI